MTTEATSQPKRPSRLPVIAPDGRWYPSTTSAAIALKVRSSTAWTNARLGRNGWRLATEADAPTKPAS